MPKKTLDYHVRLAARVLLKRWPRKTIIDRRGIYRILEHHNCEYEIASKSLVVYADKSKSVVNRSFSNVAVVVSFIASLVEMEHRFLRGHEKLVELFFDVLADANNVYQDHFAAETLMMMTTTTVE